ncbi:hypothetical protein G6F65_012218 [Rhizopus arrhizus]|nr:hypothetical protein G6F65_012218 [Rhizopus arrhizus]
MAIRLLERRASLLIHQPGQWFGKGGLRIARCPHPLGLDIEGPARPGTAKRVVLPRRRGNQLALCRTVQVGAAKLERALKRTIFVQHNARRDQPGPGPPVGQQRGPLAVFGKVQHGGVPSHVQQRAVLDVPGKHGHELRIDTRTPDRQRVADDPEHHAGNPQLQAQPDGGG